VWSAGRDKLGIFRLSGNARTVGELTTACGDLIAKKAGEEDMQKLFEPYADGEMHVVASVLKAYLREQKEPLLPASFYDSFISAAGKPAGLLSLRVACAHTHSRLCGCRDHGCR
jgi:hypothetical protein